MTFDFGFGGSATAYEEAGSTGAAEGRDGVPASRRGRVAPGSPRAVTRGESHRKLNLSQDSGVKAKIDWLRATFDWDGSVLDLLNELSERFGQRLIAREAGGLHYFETRLIVSVYAGATALEVGSIAYGGKNQKGRWLLEMTGTWCGLFDKFGHARMFLEEHVGEITRVDLAVDLLDGKYRVDDACYWWRDGKFNNGGRSPVTKMIGDVLERIRGVTLYIGKFENGKGLCIYEKGKQKGDFDSDWTRFEVRLGNRDRVVPLDVLDHPDAYFVGAYPALQCVLDAAPAKIKTQIEECRVSLDWLMGHLKRCYGKLINTAVNHGYPITDLVEEVRVLGVPRRLSLAGVVTGQLKAAVSAKLRRSNHEIPSN